MASCRAKERRRPIQTSPKTSLGPVSFASTANPPRRLNWNEVPRRAQLALALILLLVLAPLAGANCGIECLAATPHPSMHAASAQHDCIRASTCCHSGGQTICRAANTADAPAALLSADTTAPHDAPALAVAVAADTLPQNPRTIAARGIHSSPPGQLSSSLPIPLRV
jgi:hypothetical protein